MAQVEPKIAVEYAGNATIAVLTAKKILREDEVAALEASMMPLIEAESGVNLVIDFSGVEFLTSSVLGLLIRISKRVYQAEGQLALCNIIPKILEIFKITRLTNIFDIYDDIETATKALSPS